MGRFNWQKQRVCRTKRFLRSIFSPTLNYSFLFIEFRNVDEANLALVALNNHPFDAKHTFKLNRFADIEKYANLDETYVEPEAEEFVPKVSLHFQKYRSGEIYDEYRNTCERGWLILKDGTNM